MIAIANAPVSYGVFELAGEPGVVLPTADELLDQVAVAGYAGIDSGPIGLFGRGEQLRANLTARDLLLAGGWASMPFSEPEAYAAARPEFERTIQFFADAAALAPSPELAPKPTLADDGSDARRAQPGGGPGLSLDDARWAIFEENLADAAAIVRAAGLEPTFHHHACTHVETPEEIDAFLDRTDVGLTFDTGHLLLGGGDPLAGLTRWGSRINHLHLKDVRRQVLADVVARRGGMRDVWTGGAFVPLGTGDLDLDAVLAWIRDGGFDGWLVVEQDVIPFPGDEPGKPQADQIHNRTVLKEKFA